MLVKCLLLIFVCVIPLYSELLEAYGVYRSVTPGNCSYPHLEHGRIRVRQRARLVKFLCMSGYELVGNKYATCRDGKWDVSMPVCVKPGCSDVPHIENGIEIPLRKGAWVVFFCVPGHRIEGSSVIYCDGKRWNDTVPVCIDAATPPSLNCDFESSTLCGWTQDELHDFDWRRLNRKTPSSFLFTGPSYDHTYGESGLGYYMYIESTSQRQNDTARLISPIYDATIAKDGCFSFYYHMFGRATGGLRVYQKPENYPLQAMLELSTSDKNKYLLFEKWGNQGNTWYGAVAKLTDFSDNFQIVIEGIRGPSFTSDIAIDDVSLLPSNCTIKEDISSTTELSEAAMSCAGRCDIIGARAPEFGCGCTATCITDSDCCADFAELCVFPMDMTTTETPPQTEKLIMYNTTVTDVEIRDVPTTTLRTTTLSTTVPTTIMTTKPTRKTTITTPSTTTKRYTTTKKLPLVTKPTTVATTTQTPTTKMIITTLVTKTTASKPRDYGNATTKFDKYYQKIDKPSQEWETRNEARTNENKSSTAAIFIVLALVASICVSLGILSRTKKGRMVFDRLRRQNSADSEVRYLTTHEDQE